MEDNKALNPESRPEAEEIPTVQVESEEQHTLQVEPEERHTVLVEPEERHTVQIEPEEFPTTPVAEAPKKDWKKEAREWIVSIAAALLVVFFCRNYLFQIIRVDGNSMFDTLLDNERLLVSVLDVRLHGVERDDIVICHYPNRGNTNFVKRAVAVPGDRVYRQNGVTHVEYDVTAPDGSVETVDEMLDERLQQYFPGPSSEDYEPYTLGEDEYFVVGDNRYNSHDSRDWNDNDPSMDVGPITGDMIVGRVRKVIWPISNFRDPQ